MEFQNFLEQEEFVDRLLLEFDNPSGDKPWSATKDQILNIWRGLRPDTPIYITPMAKNKEGGTQSYGEDGIRITGSYNFVTSILAKLKEIIGYENPQSKLRLVFRGIDKSRNPRPDANSYVFYLNLEKRSHGKPGRRQKKIGI